MKKTICSTYQQFLKAANEKTVVNISTYISEDSFDWMQIRQGDIVEDAILKVGIYSASPNSEDGFEVTFEDFMIKDEKR